MSPTTLLSLLAWPIILVSSLIVAGPLEFLLGGDVALFVTALFSAFTIGCFERMLPFAASWNESDGEESTDGMHIVLLAITDDVTRGIIARWAVTQLDKQPLEARWAETALWVQIMASLLIGELGGWFSHWLLHVR